MLFAPVTAKRFPLIIWNQSSSVPIGLYWVEQKPPRAGDLAVVRLPDHTAELALRRDYLPRSAYLLKLVAAVGGDRVCRHGANVFIGGAFVARALAADPRQRSLPHWQGCRILRTRELFLLGRTPASFDGRYFGPIQRDYVVGRARLIVRTL